MMDDSEEAALPDVSTSVVEPSISRRKSFRPRKLKRAYSPTWKAEIRVDASKKRKTNSMRTLAAIANRPYDKLPNGEPFSCAVCKSPYVSKPASRTGKTDKRRSVHMPYPKARIDPITGREMLICNPCSQTFENPRRRRLPTKVTPTEQEVETFLEEAKTFAKYLAELYNEPAAVRLYCPGRKNKTCGCLERNIRQSGDAMAERVTMLLGLTEQAKVLREQKCYPIPPDDQPTSPTKTKAKKVKNVGLGNGHKKCRAYEEFVFMKRQTLKEDLGLCERATQRILLYSNNFLFKKLKTEPRPCRITRTKGKAALGQLTDLDTIDHTACCNDNCVLMVLSHRSLLQSWRERAGQGQAEARRVLAEMLTPAGGYRLNCYKFISMVTGCAKGTIQRVNMQMRETGGNRDPPIHGMKKVWLEQHRASTEAPESKKSDKNPHSQSGSKQEVTSQSKSTNNIAVSSYKAWQNELQQQQILKMQHRILEQQQQLLMQQQFFEVALNNQRIVSSSVDSSDKQTTISNLQPTTEQQTVNPGNVIQLQLPVPLDQLPNVQFVLKQPNALTNQLNPVSNLLNPVTNQLDPVANQLNPAINQPSLVLNQTQYQVVTDPNYPVYDETISSQTPIHTDQTDDASLIKLSTSDSQIQLIQQGQTITNANFNSGQIQFQVVPNDLHITVAENQLQQGESRPVLFSDNGKDRVDSDNNTSDGLPPNVDVQTALQLDNIPNTVSMVTFENGHSNMAVASETNAGTQVAEIQSTVLPPNIQIMTNSQNDPNSNKILEFPIATQPFQIQNFSENRENLPTVTPQIQQLQDQIELASQLISATGNQYDSSLGQNEGEESSSVHVQGHDGSEDVLAQANNDSASQTFTIVYQNGVPIQAFLNADAQTISDTGVKADGGSISMAEFESISSDFVTNTTQGATVIPSTSSDAIVSMNNTVTGMVIGSDTVSTAETLLLQPSSVVNIANNASLGYSDQCRSRSACASAQSDQDLHCSPFHISTTNSTQASVNITPQNQTFVSYIGQSSEKSFEFVSPNKNNLSSISTLLPGNQCSSNSGINIHEVDGLEQINQWNSQSDNLVNGNILIGQNSNFQINSNNSDGQTVYAVISPNHNLSTESTISWTGQNMLGKTNVGSPIRQNSSINNTNLVIGQNSSNEREASFIDHSLTNSSVSIQSAVNRTSLDDNHNNPKKRWRNKSSQQNSERQSKKGQLKTGTMNRRQPKQMMRENTYDRGKETMTSKPSNNVLQTKCKANSVLQSMLAAPPKYVQLQDQDVLSTTVQTDRLRNAKNTESSPPFVSHTVSHTEQTSTTRLVTVRNAQAPRAKLPRILKSVPHIKGKCGN